MKVMAKTEFDEQNLFGTSAKTVGSPNVKHWHGTKANSWFSHIAVEVPGTDIENDWCEKVSDEAYEALCETGLRFCMC